MMSNYFRNETETEDTELDEIDRPKQDVGEQPKRKPKDKANLPPLKITRNDAPKAATTGGVAKSVKNTIISIPEGYGCAPAEAGGAGIVSLPGDNETDPLLAGPSGTTIRGPPSTKPLEMIVYFTDKTGIKLAVEDGQNASAGEIFEMVLEEMALPAACRHVFSLWLISDLLELQLKPNQIPFKLVCFWEEFLEKYSSASAADIERDEPVIMFQRNIFYSRYDEKDLNEVEILRLLYHEAKQNVLEGRYPLQQDGYDKLAGFQAAITFKAFNGEKHTAKFYTDKVKDFYPEHLFRRGMFGRNVKDLDQRLQLAHYHAHVELSQLKKKGLEDNALDYKQYLAYCRKLPFYGAAFFNGQIEHPSGIFSFFASKDDPVYIAVNMEGLFVIDMDDVDFLLGLLHRELTWQYAEPVDRENPNCLPCLFVKFESDERDQPVDKLLQIFTREAVLVDALIRSCIMLRKENNEGEFGTDDIDGDGRQDDVVMKSEGETWKKFNRLCLATVDKNQKLIKSNIRQKKKLNSTA